MFTEVLIGFILLFMVYLFNKKPTNLPPGIWGLPFIGSFPRKDIHIVDQAKEHSKKFGEIFTWRIGSRIYIFLCNYDTIKAALKRPEFSGRAEFFSGTVVTNFVNAGVASASGKLWQNNRRFGLFHLKNLGLGKSSYETVIQDEVMCLLKDFESCVDKKPEPIAWSLNVAVLNVIWRICADRRYDVNDMELQYFHKLMEGLFSNVPFLLTLYDNFPWLHKIVPSFLNKWGGVENFTDIYKELEVFLQRIIDDYKKTIDTGNPRDFIDQYLIEMKKQKDNLNSTMSDLDLMRFIMDLFGAGSETTSSTTRWAIFYLAKYPEIQTRVQEELDSVVAKNTLPSLTDRERLPYLELSCDSRNSKNRITRPYVPSSCGNRRHNTQWLFYTKGKRSCLGESLAIMELFLFVSALIQKFTFALPQGEDLNPKKNPQNRLINVCKPYKVVIKMRC